MNCQRKHHLLLRDLQVLHSAFKDSPLSPHSLKLTLGFGIIVVELLLPLGVGELAYLSDKQIFIVVTAEPVHTEEKDFV